MLDQRLSTIPQHQWVSKLFGYDFSVELCPSRLNTVVDALSRHGKEDASLSALSGPSFKLYDDLRRGLRKTPYCVSSMTAWSPSAVRHGTWCKGLVLHGTLVFVPATSVALPVILQMARSAGHKGI
jgi:hypothetical protein